MRICVLGFFGFRTTLYDGQTIKTRNILELLRSRNLNVDYYDTQDFRINKKSIFSMFAKIWRCDQLFYLPAHNNLRYIFPVVFLLSKFAGVDVHYFVVGGWLKEFIEKKPFIKYCLSRIKGIHSETLSMKQSLEINYGFKNVDVFPNFRIHDFVSTVHHDEGKLKIVFMARILRKKGLDSIFVMGDHIIKNKLEESISVDFYGPLHDREYFEENILKYRFMKYHGPLEPEQIYATLEKYDVMVFPTHFYTEGLPGSILDAYISGIPVVATKWKYATEFIVDGQCGCILPFEDDGTILYEKILYLFRNPEVLSKMKEGAKAQKYIFSSENAWNLIESYIRK